MINETLGKLSSAARFTKLDIIHAFNGFQIKKDQKWLTAFNTRYSQFKYLVMLFGLCNVPEMFQSYINSLLQEYLNVFCIAYLDDILIYSKNDKKYTDHVLKVLKRLREKGLQLDINKCKFSVIEIKYLELIVTTKSICMNLEKVQAIIDWESPTTVKDMQAFLGFAGFYQQFIAEFFRMTKPLIKMTKDNHVTIRSGKSKIQIQLFSIDRRLQKIVPGFEIGLYDCTSIGTL